MHKLKKTQIVLSCLTLSWAILAGAAAAAPYSITYTGTVSASGFPDATAGETYDVTFVFDNGGATPIGQIWTGANLRCTIWRFNAARNFVFTQNLLAEPPSTVLGSVTTNGAGVLTANFSNVRDNDGIAPANYTVTGGTLDPVIRWFANSTNDMMYDFWGSVADASGGLQMGVANWSNPAPFAGNCAGLVLGPPPTSVPTLSDFALWLMTLSLMTAGFFYTRRWAFSRSGRR